MIIGMGSLMTVVGIGVADFVGARVLEATGNGDKVVFLHIISWVAAGLIAWEIWFKGVGFVKSSFFNMRW